MASVNSMNSNFVKRELSYAISQNKRIVPIIIDKSELSNWHKFNLGHINCMDFQDEQDMDKLMAELYSWLKIDSIQNIISKYKISFPIKELCTKEAIQDLLLEFDSNPHNLITVDSSDIKNFLGRCEKVKYTIINLDMIDDNNGVSIIKRVLSEHVKQYSNIILNLIGCVDKIKIGEIQDFLSIFAPESNIIWGVRDSHIRNEIILILGR